MIAVTMQLDGVVSDAEAGGAEVPCRIFDLAVDFDTLEADFATYDPSSGTSPSVTVARKYVRVLFDAYAASKET